MNIQLRYLSVIFIVFSLTLPVKAQNNFQQQKDSLLNIIPTLKGEEKLLAYKKYAQLPLHPSELDDNLAVLNKFIDECKQQGNLQMEGDALVDKLVKLYNYNRKEQLLEEIENALAFFSKNEQWDNYYLIYHLYIESYIFDKQYEKALQMASDIYSQAKKQNNISGLETAAYLLGLAYVNQTQLDEAEKFFKETISFSDDPNRFNNARRRAYEDLCRVLLKKKQYRKALEKGEELKNFYDNYMKSHPEAQRNKQYADIIYYRINAEAYFGLEEYDKVEYYCDLTKKTAPMDARAMAYIYYLSAQANEKQGLYEKAIKNFEASENFYLQMHDVPSIVLRDKARVLCKMDRGKEAYPIYEAVIDSNEVSFQSLMDSKLDELRTIYEVDKLTAEKEISRQRVIIAATIIVLLFILLFVYMLYSRRLKRKNESLFLQIQELNRAEKVAEERLVNTPEESLSKEMLLFRRLSECMQRDKLYLNSDLNRKNLADHLGTNESYLADAIKVSTGETFSSYISNLRLHYALELLEHSLEITLDAVAIDSGHASYSPFYRAFIKKYGITPSEYRKLSSSKEKVANANTTD